MISLQIKIKYFFVFVCAVSLLFSCSAGVMSGSSDDAQVRKWTIPGKARFFSDATTDADVKLAVFYVNSTTAPTSLSTSYQIAGSVTNLGNIPSQFSDFSLNVDCTKVTPSDKQLLYLFMWRDLNNDNIFTSGETSAVCVSKSDSGSLSFTDGVTDTNCYYIYVGYNGDPSDDLGTKKGWNQSFGLKYININKAVINKSGKFVVPEAVIECSL